MKKTIKKDESKIVKKPNVIKDENIDKKTPQWFEEDEDWSDLYDETVNEPKE